MSGRKATEPLTVDHSAAKRQLADKALASREREGSTKKSPVPGKAD